MSIYRLSSDAWEYILPFLDVYDTMRMYLSGDTSLWTCLRPAIREFVICLATTKAPSLSSLLRSFKASSSHPSRFSISLKRYFTALRFPSEHYTVEKWKTFFPEKLETLELLLERSEAPFTTIIASLSTLAPQLKTFRALNIPCEPTLPSSLKKIELGVHQHWNHEKPTQVRYNIIESLPTTLTHLKLHNNLRVVTDMDASKIPFKNLPLTVFYASISFRALSEEEALWSILPNSIVDLSARLTYGLEETLFASPPPDSAWTHLFPNLTSLTAPLGCLANDSIFKGCLSAHTEQFPEEQMKSISACFPASLTSLSTFSRNEFFHARNIPPVIRAIGDRLRTFEIEKTEFSRDALKSLSRWENPSVQLVEIVIAGPWVPPDIAEGENFENFFENKNHPLQLLYRNARSLKTGLLPSSALPFLPRTLTSLDCSVVQRDSISLHSVSQAIDRRSARNKNIDKGEVNLEYDRQLGWTQLGWPNSLTILNLSVMHSGAQIHLGCLPATITDLSIAIAPLTWLEQGSTLAHMTKLQKFSVHGNFSNIISSLNELPKSLRSISSISASFADGVFNNPAFENYFDHLDTLALVQHAYSVDSLLYLPKTLTQLVIETSKDSGVCWSEKHFENIARTQLVFLALSGDAKWPEDLNVDVFSRFMPKTLASLRLRMDDWPRNDEFAASVAQHIPSSLLFFYSMDSKLLDLVNFKIRQKNLSSASTE